jgi:hypothetical protein
LELVVGRTDVFLTAIAKPFSRLLDVRRKTGLRLFSVTESVGGRVLFESVSQLTGRRTL